MNFNWVKGIITKFGANGYLKTVDFEVRHKETIQAIESIRSELHLHTSQDSEQFSAMHREIVDGQERHTDRLIKIIMGSKGN